ncbi:MAG: hypothetical protein KDA61_00665 [Planctomycetales bacterium]|nr:hypothetical protein [Planctomycetales bacterium]
MAKKSCNGWAIAGILAWAAWGAAGADARGQDAPASTPTSMAFGWPFLSPEQTATRGGTTQGVTTKLDLKPSEAWRALQESNLNSLARDRQAILALAGVYRVSFQFVESMGFQADYSPAQPYFSWATEEVRVLSQTDRSVSLQHTLVMFFDESEGMGNEPYVTKHWRQDWTYEDRDLHVYEGDRTWSRKRLAAEAVHGSWTQAVYQVDDSPRYEVVGRWTHEGGASRWSSEDSWRPLPRREFSVRDDYNVLAGAHTITVTPTGWVHEQNNRKLQVGAGDTPSCLACETGLNRYERIGEPDVAGPANRYWQATGDYWAEVRKAWERVLANHDRFRIKAEVDGERLYESHFAYAALLEDAAQDDRSAESSSAARRNANETVARFVEPIE